MLHAVKQGEWNGSLVVRVSNLSDVHVDARLTVNLPFSRAWLVDAMEQEDRGDLAVDGPVVTIPLPPKKIATVSLQIDGDSSTAT